MKKLITLALSCLLTLGTVFANNQDTKLKNSLERINQNAQETVPYTVEVSGLAFWADGHVFSPRYFKSTEFLTSSIPFKPNQRFLEVGTGIGVTAVIAAKNWNNSVVALDLNPAAVKLAKKNAAKNKAKNIDIRESDVFSALRSTERFDTIYWDLPYVYAKDEKECSLMIQKAVCDPGYKAIEKFLSHVRNHLKTDGRIFLGFGTNGDEERFDSLLKKYKFKKKLVNSKTFNIRGGMTYYLYQIEDAVR